MDTRIRNTVYGLAIGDALGYPTEFLSVKESIRLYGGEPLWERVDPLIVSDDTQMSIALVKGFLKWHESGDHQNGFAYYVADEFLEWLDDPRNDRAPGNACISSLSALKQRANHHVRDIDRHELSSWGHLTTPNSMGSGTVMRAPWMGLLHGLGIITGDDLADFSRQHSVLTHGHDTATTAAHLTSLITSRLLRHGDRGGGGVLSLMARYAHDSGDAEIQEMKTRLCRIPDEWFFDEDHENADVGQWFSSHWKATNVLGSAFAVFNSSHGNPHNLASRIMFNSQDTDTLGAIAGAFLGASNGDPDLWGHLPELIEPDYLAELDWIADSISMLADGRH